MKHLGFRPQGKDDWRLLLRLAKLIRLSSRAEIALLVAYGEARQERVQATGTAYTPRRRVRQAEVGG